MYFQTKVKQKEVVNTDEIASYWKDGDSISIFLKSGEQTALNYETTQDMKSDFAKLTSILKKKENNVFGNFKEFVEKHKSQFYVIGALLLIDHVVFDGKYRNKLSELFEAIIKKVKDSLEV